MQSDIQSDILLLKLGRTWPLFEESHFVVRQERNNIVGFDGISLHQHARELPAFSFKFFQSQSFVGPIYSV